MLQQTNGFTRRSFSTFSSRMLIVWSALIIVLSSAILIGYFEYNVKAVLINELMVIVTSVLMIFISRINLENELPFGKVYKSYCWLFAAGFFFMLFGLALNSDLTAFKRLMFILMYMPAIHGAICLLLSTFSLLVLIVCKSFQWVGRGS